MNLSKIILLLSFIILTCAGNVKGQDIKTDSLLYLLSEYKKEDTVKVNLLNEIANVFYKKNTALSGKYARDAYALAVRLKYYEGEALSLWLQGKSEKKDKQKALDYYLKADQMAEVAKDKKRCTYILSIANQKSSMGDIKGATEMYDKAIAVAESMEDADLIATGRLSLARFYLEKGKTEKAAECLRQIISGQEQTIDKKLLGRSYFYLAILNSRTSNFPTALDYYYQAINLFERKDPTYVLCLLNIAGVQAEHKDRDAAIKTAFQALDVSEENKDSLSVANCYALLGNLHILSDKRKALEYYEKSLSIPVTSESYLSGVYMRMGTIYTSFKEFDKAEFYFEKSIELALKYNALSKLGPIYVRYSDLYLSRKDFNKALKYADKALAASEKSNVPLLKEESHRQLSKIYAEMGRYKDALGHYTAHTQIRDSVFKENNLRKLALIESDFAFSRERDKFQSEKMMNEARLKKQTQIIWLFVVILVLVIILFSLYFRWWRLKKEYLTLKIERINQELDANRKDMALAQLKLLQNSERDSRTVKKLEDAAKTMAQEQKMDIRSVIVDYKQDAVASNWDEFEATFSQINSPFSEKLNALYPDLTPNERKLCVFLKLNMSNKDIAQITYQTDDALKKSRTRLRRKLGLERNENLSVFIQNI